MASFIPPHDGQQKIGDVGAGFMPARMAVPMGHNLAQERCVDPPRVAVEFFAQLAKYIEVYHSPNIPSFHYSVSEANLLSDLFYHFIRVFSRLMFSRYHLIGKVCMDI